MVASYWPVALGQEPRLLAILSRPLLRCPVSYSAGARTSFGGSKSKDLRGKPCSPPTGLGDFLERSAPSMHFSVSRSPRVLFSRYAPSALPSRSIFTKKLTEPPRNSTREAPCCKQRCSPDKLASKVLFTFSSSSP